MHFLDSAGGVLDVAAPPGEGIVVDDPGGHMSVFSDPKNPHVAHDISDVRPSSWEFELGPMDVLRFNGSLSLLVCGFVLNAARRSKAWWGSSPSEKDVGSRWAEPGPAVHVCLGGQLEVAVMQLLIDRLDAKVASVLLVEILGRAVRDPLLTARC